MTLIIVKYGIKRDLENLNDFLKHGWEVVFATAIKDEIHYILDKK